jgi:hypothetical protein
MKRRIFILLILFSFLSGCASLQVKREVVDNVFFSSYPSFTVKVSSDLKYMGHTKRQDIKISVDGSSDLDYKFDYYIWGTEHNNKIVSLLYCQIEKISTYFVSDFWRSIKNKLEEGKISLGGKYYQYNTKVTYPRGSKSVSGYLLDKGYVTPCGLFKSAGRLFGARGDYLISIRFYKNLEDSGFSCQSFNKKEDLTDDQREYLREFNKEFDTMFEVLD